MMEQKHKVALIGYGYWGKKLFSYLRESEQFDLRCVHLRSLEGFDAQDLMWDLGVEFVSSLETIWGDEGVRSVVIATPIGTHFELALEALERGKHVLVEKPLAETGGEAWLLKRKAEAGDLCLMTDFTWTFSKGLQCVQKMVAEGKIGAVQGLSISWRQLGRFVGQDVYAMLGSHALSILDMFVPLEECSFSAGPVTRMEGKVTEGMIEVVWPGGYAGIEVTLHCPVRRRRVVVYGDKGRVMWDPSSILPLEVSVYSGGVWVVGSERHLWFDEGQNLRYALEEFALVLEGKESNVDLAVKVTEILEGLR